VNVVGQIEIIIDFFFKNVHLPWQCFTHLSHFFTFRNLFLQYLLGHSISQYCEASSTHLCYIWPIWAGGMFLCTSDCEPFQYFSVFNVLKIIKDNEGLAQRLSMTELLIHLPNYIWLLQKEKVKPFSYWSKNPQTPADIWLLRAVAKCLTGIQLCSRLGGGVKRFQLGSASVWKHHPGVHSSFHWGYHCQAKNDDCFYFYLFIHIICRPDIWKLILCPHVLGWHLRSNQESQTSLFISESWLSET